MRVNFEIGRRIVEEEQRGNKLDEQSHYSESDLESAIISKIEITLPPDANIHAAKYQLYLPSKDELQQQLNEWLAESQTEVGNTQPNNNVLNSKDR